MSILPPDGRWSGPVVPRQFVENRQLRDGSFLSVYNELYHPANGANHISIFLSPLLNSQGIVGVKAGKWTVRLHGQEVRDGKFDAWSERDDPVRVGVADNREAWRFPAYLSERSNVDDSSVGEASSRPPQDNTMSTGAKAAGSTAEKFTRYFYAALTADVKGEFR